ncbi:MAG: hypothetical protein ACI945_000962, partial [Pseudohongiellaceae bacterium]
MDADALGFQLVKGRTTYSRDFDTRWYGYQLSVRHL